MTDNALAEALRGLETVASALEAWRDAIRQHRAIDPSVMGLSDMARTVRAALAAYDAAPAPGSAGWEAGRDAAAELFHPEQVRVWADEILSDLALNAGVVINSYDDKVSAFCAIHETLTEIANMIRSLAPPAPPAPSDGIEAGMRRAADVCDRVADGYDKAGDRAIATGIRLTKNAILAASPAPWTPPEDREIGYSCVAHVVVDWVGDGWVTDCPVVRGAANYINPTAFAPLPYAKEQES